MNRYCRFWILQEWTNANAHSPFFVGEIGAVGRKIGYVSEFRESRLGKIDYASERKRIM